MVPSSTTKKKLDYDRVFGKMAPSKLYRVIDDINSSLKERKTVIQRKSKMAQQVVKKKEKLHSFRMARLSHVEDYRRELEERNITIQQSIEDEYHQFDDLAALQEKAGARARAKEQLEKERGERAYQRALTLKRQSSKWYKPPTEEELAEQEKEEQAQMEAEQSELLHE